MTVLLLPSCFIRWITRICLINCYVTSVFHGLIRISCHHCTAAIIISLTMWWIAGGDMNTWWPFFYLILTLIVHSCSHHARWWVIIASACLNYILINESSDVPCHPKLVIMIHFEYIKRRIILLLNSFAYFYWLIWEDGRVILLLLLLLIFYDTLLHKILFELIFWRRILNHGHWWSLIN